MREDERRRREHLELLLVDFPACLDAFLRAPPFTGAEAAARLRLQRSLAVQRGRHESLRGLVGDDEFLSGVCLLLGPSVIEEELPAFLPSVPELRDALWEGWGDLAYFEPPMSSRLGRENEARAELLASLIGRLGIADDANTLVVGAGFLGHLLPRLLLPVDAHNTPAFFAMDAGQLTADSARIRVLLDSFGVIAAEVSPERYVGWRDSGWMSSRSAVVGNAIAGFVRRMGIGASGRRPAPARAARPASPSPIPDELRRELATALDGLALMAQDGEDERHARVAAQSTALAAELLALGDAEDGPGSSSDVLLQALGEAHQPLRESVLYERVRERGAAVSPEEFVALAYDLVTRGLVRVAVEHDLPSHDPAPFQPRFYRPAT